MRCRPVADNGGVAPGHARPDEIAVIHLPPAVLDEPVEEIGQLWEGGEEFDQLWEGEDEVDQVLEEEVGQVWEGGD